MYFDTVLFVLCAVFAALALFFIAYLLASRKRSRVSANAKTRSLPVRRIITLIALLSLIVSCCAFAGGYYLYSAENAAVLATRPEIITVSLQQSRGFTVEKYMADGRTAVLENSQIKWEFSRDNIARIDGGRISGINEGKTTIRGTYRNNSIELTVRVVRPMDGMVDISQIYEQGRKISVFAGSADRAITDGALAAANFISPESITVTENGTVFMTDVGSIRKLSDGVLETVPIAIGYMSAAVVRSYDNELYMLTDPWQDGGKYYYALARLRAGVEVLYIAEALYTAVEDFNFGSDGLLYFIDRNERLGGIFLRTLDLSDADDVRTLCHLPPGSASLTVAGDGSVYIGNADAGAIYVYRDGNLEYFAGLDGERAFIDGASPRFYSPQRLEHSSGYLYVWDFNTLRRLDVQNGIAGECITLAGMASPDYELALSETIYPAEDVVLPHGKQMDFALTSGGILLTDPKRGVVWQIG